MLTSLPDLLGLDRARVGVHFTRALAEGAGCIHGLRLREPRLASRSHPVVVVVVIPGVVVVVVVVLQRPRGSSSSSLGTEGPG